MNRSTLIGADGSANFQVLLEDGERLLCRVNGHANAGGSVLAVLPAAEHPTSITLDRLAHECRLKEELDAAWAVRPIELVREGGRTMLVLEDPGGEPLEQLIGAPLKTDHFLRSAIGITVALGKLHRRGLLHKDIKPANFMVNCADGQVRLTGFGIASCMPRERQAPDPPETIAGTLAYMAPEQTGRMNRSIDSRSDLYALGVSFYQMLTGSLPFTAADPLEWVHCHIARKPQPPNERLENIPAPVSEIIMKLLAKTAEERYQTAAGVESDLRRCLAEHERKGCIDPFALGEHDAPDRLLLPEKLYGRSREIGTLLACFDHMVNNGATELVLVSGYSGIGKSSVVNELHRVLVPSRGLFASGKFDQYKRDIPYSTLAQAFQSLIRPLLGKSDPELAVWREAFRKALGPNGRLIIDLVPELELIIDDQPPVPELAPQDAQRRFQLVFRRFLAVFARPEHPLALFLDDLQWLDSATLDLLEDLLTQPDVQHLMLVGAYRDNEVDPAHPLIRKLEAIRKAGAVVHEINLAPLACEALGRLIGDALHCEPKSAIPLAQLVHEKTAGNPFFAIQFLSALAEEGLLSFDHGNARWSWDLNSVRAKGYTDNVVDLMVGKLNRLPVETTQALRLLACMGNSAEFALLEMASQQSSEEMHGLLWEAIRAGLIFRSEHSYTFLHDRVQEAAYSLIPENVRAETHLRIGKLLAACISREKQEEAIFEIVNQINRGSHLITAAEECERFAELNLIAGGRAKSSTAYRSALTYLGAGRALLTEAGWDQNHELIFAIEFHTAECELLTANMTAADDRLLMLAQRARRVQDITAVVRLRSMLYTTLGRSDRGVEVCLEYLQRDGTSWSSHPTSDEVHREYDRIWRQLGSRSIEELVDLPSMTDPDSLAALDVLQEVSTSAQFTDQNLFSLVVCRMVNLSLEYGNTDASPFAYVLFCIIAGPYFGNYTAGFRFGRLGYELIEKPGLKRFQARTYLAFADLVMPWTTPVRVARDLVRRASDCANEIGDFTFVAYSGNALNTNLLAVGDPLGEAQREAESGLEFAQKARFGLVIDFITAQLGLIRTLRGLTPTFGSFNDDRFSELAFELHLGSGSNTYFSECAYWIRKLQARFFAGDYTSALKAAMRAQPLLWTVPSFLETAEYHFYGALSHAASWDFTPSDEKQQHFEALKAHHKQLDIWAQNCPENFENRAALAAAEIARIEARDLDSLRLYEQAIHSARANGFIHNEALAYELAARFYATRGFEEIAHLYQRNARQGYQRWGADGKVRQLDQRYPHLRLDERTPPSTRTIEAPVEHLDLTTVIKMSQAVSRDIVLDKLLETLMRVAIEQSGAVRGLLILPRGAGQQIAAEAAIDGDTVAVHLADEPVTAAALPEAILHYVLHTRDSVIIDEATAQPPFSADSYVLQHQARSVLCMPLLNQSKLIGVLYLENNLTPRVFAPARIEVLKLLASQAAISLENARLYREVAEREAKIRRLVEANIIGIFIWDLEGRIIEANDAFLRMVGYDREDLISGRIRWKDLTPPEWRDRNEHAVEEVRTTGIAQPHEKEYFRKDGSCFPVLIGAASFGEAENQGVAFVLDLTQHKRAEEALRESEAKFSDYAETTSDWLWEIGPDYKFTLLTENAFGSNPAVRIGTTCWDHALDLETEPDKWRLVRATLDSRKPLRDFVYCSVGGNGSPIHVKVSGKPVFDASGEFRGYRGTGTDVTAIVRAQRAEASLRTVQAELAHVSRVTTLGQLTASIAHEIFQPITSARNNAHSALNFLDRSPPDLDEVREALGCIVSNTDRAEGIIDRIRDQIKKAPPRNDRFDLNQAIGEVIRLVQSTIIENGILVETRFVHGSASVRGDRVQLQQVILNLILNAIEAMSTIEAGQRELLISTEQSQKNCTLVTVCDSGPGIHPKDLGRVFEAFYTTKSDGMGMGLSICSSIIDAHGGRLWAETNEDGGGLFQFTLPSAEIES